MNLVTGQSAFKHKKSKTIAQATEEIAKNRAKNTNRPKKNRSARKKKQPRTDPKLEFCKLLSKNGWKNYADYLSSDLWKSIRRKVLDRDSYECRLCGDNATSVHHLKYDADTMLGVATHNLMAVCGKCHCRVEFKPNGNKRPIKRVAHKTRRELKYAKYVKSQHNDLDREYDSIVGCGPLIDLEPPRPETIVTGSGSV